MAVYDVFVRMTMMNGVSGALALIAQDVLRLQGGVNNLQTAFGGLNRTVLATAGALSMVAGVGVLSGLKKVADHGDKLLDQQDKLQRAGISYNEVLRLQANYYENIAKQIPTSTVSDYLKTVNELRSVVGPAKAEEKAPMTMMLSSLMGNMAEGRGNAGERVDKLWQAIGMRGTLISDPKGSDKLAAIMARNIMGSGGKLTPDTYLQLGRRGGVAWASADPEFIAGPLSSVAQDLGGASAGMALMSLYQTTSGATVLGKQQAAELRKLGALDPAKVHPIKGSGNIKADPGAILGYELAARRPDLWVQQYLMPRLHAVYGNDQAKIDSALAVIGRNRNVVRMLTTFGDPGFIEQQRQDAAVWAQTHGVKQSYIDAISRNPKMVKEAFGLQYESMMQSIGAPMMQAALPVMREVTAMFTEIGKWANANPEKIKQIATGLAAFGAVLVGGGAAAMIAALGPAGWLVMGIGALAAAVTAMPKADYERLKAELAAVPGHIASLKKSIVDMWATIKKGFFDGVAKLGIDKLWDTIAAAGKKLVDSLKGTLAPAFEQLIPLFERIKSAIGSAIEWILSKLRMLPGVGSLIPGEAASTVFDRMRGLDTGGRSMSRVGGGKLGFGMGGPVGSKGHPITGASDVDMSGGGGFNTRGVRNMNPGNIAWGPWARAHGATGGAGSDTGHLVAVFPSHAAGAAALESLAASKYAGGKRSVDALIAGRGGWTPGNHAAAANVARKMGISPHADANLRDPAMMRRFRDSLMVQELGPAGARHVRERLKDKGASLNFKPHVRTASGPVIENVMVLDGDVVHRSVNKRMLRKAEHSRQAPYFNGQGMFAGPDAKFAVG